MASSEYGEDVVRQEIDKKRYDDNLNYKITDAYIIDIVHNYFCIFHSWLPADKDAKGKFIVKMMGLLCWSTLVYFLLFIFNNATKMFIDFYLTSFFVIAIIISWLLLSVVSTIGFLLLSPKKVETIQNRMKSELDIDTSHLIHIKDKNYFIAKFELENIWLKMILADNESVKSLMEKIESNINNRKPSSRDVDSVLLSILKSPITISFTAGLLTALVTLLSRNLMPSTDEIFSNLALFGSIMIYIWSIFVVTVFGIRVLFMTFILSIENSTKNKMLVIWRYEIFKNMLARHQKLTIRKPRVRYVPVLESKKE